MRESWATSVATAKHSILLKARWPHPAYLSTALALFAIPIFVGRFTLIQIRGLSGQSLEHATGDEHEDIVELPASLVHLWDRGG